MRVSPLTCLVRVRGVPVLLWENDMDTALTDYNREALEFFRDDGIDPGGFLAACLENDLTRAMGRADLQNRDQLFPVCVWMYNECPRGIWGSHDLVFEYLAKIGREKLEERINAGSSKDETGG